ncbi:MAG: Deoxyribodipyrimidine photo-lyase, partial [Bacteroidota bacterium]
MSCGTYIETAPSPEFGTPVEPSGLSLVSISMNPSFPVDTFSIQHRLASVDPVGYARTRNYLHGGVSLLSPYISRGFLSPNEVLRSVLERGYDLRDIEPFVQQLAWREFFQRTWQWLEDGIFTDIRRRHTGVRHRQLPVALPGASTGIEAVDRGIQELMK